jgi:hypothetical protein
MKSVVQLRLILALVLIFALGAAAGASFNRGSAMRAQSAPGPDLVDRFLASKQAAYESRLQLSSEQLEQLRPSVEKTRTSLRASQQRATREVWTIMGEHYRALNRVLTPEQRVIFQQMIEEKKAATQRSQQP